MTLPDNRIRFPSGKIDFPADVGVTSQDHDNYPAPLAQARYDHMRMYLIGLLSQQSSYTEPTQKRDGTPWLDLNDNTLKIYINGEWVPYSTVIGLTAGASPTTLKEWYDAVVDAVAGLSPELFFGGKVTGTTADINIPESLRSKIYSDSRAFVTVNGLTIDPRSASFIGAPVPTIVRLGTHELEANDEYFVVIKRIGTSTFYVSDVVIP